jgi:hypothetical protein
MSLVVGAVFSLVGGLLVVAGVESLVTAVSLHRNDAVPVRAVTKADPPVEFDGTAEARTDDGAFAAPFSGEEALYCDVWIEAKSRHRTDVDGVAVLGGEGPRRPTNTDTSWGLVETADIERRFVVREGGARVVVDPTNADFDVDDGHTGETVLTVGEGETLSEDVRERLAALDDTGVDFDCDPATWDRAEDAVRYSEVRLDPGEPVHVAGAAVQSRPEEWGNPVDATVDAADGERLLVSEGTDSSVVRKHYVQFATGVAVGLGALAIGIQALTAAGLH